MDKIVKPKWTFSTTETTFLVRFSALEQDLMTLLRSGETDKGYACIDTFEQHNQQLVPAMEVRFLNRCVCGLVGSLAATGIEHSSNALDFVALRNYLLMDNADNPVTAVNFCDQVRAIFKRFAEFVLDQARDINPDELSKCVQQVINYIDVNEYAKLTPRAVVDALKLDFDGVTRQFKRETGLSITAYIKRAKMREAKRLLLNTDTSVRDIAAMLGYYDTANFTKRFHEEFDVPPSVYRELNQVKGHPLY